MSRLSSAEAKRAIYVDFECLKATPPHPALLGVLFGADGEELQQLILDDRLAPAAVAHRDGLRVTPPVDAVDTIVSLARAHDRRIIGWSLFDRDRMIEARPELKDDIEALYVNALTVARPWRQTIHRSFTIERESVFAPKHTLDKYALLSRYPDSRKLMGVAPATLIRHVIRGLKAAGGNYRKTTRKTKRDWHDLLDYNRHDLLALRHIVLQATRELECWRAYERTRFCVFAERDADRSAHICFMAGSRNARLDALLARKAARQWAFITAWNPASRPLPPHENAERHALLVGEVNRLGLRALEGEGVGEDPAWTPERSLLILDISRDQAERLGRQFGQLAIVVGRRGEKSRLISTAPPPKMPARNGGMHR